jgi:hypothetical protein
MQTGGVNCIVKAVQTGMIFLVRASLNGEVVEICSMIQLLFASIK